MKNINLIIRIASFILLAISAVVIVGVLTTGEGTASQDSWISSSLTWTFALLGITIAAVLIVSVLDMIANINVLIKSLAALVIMVVVFLISYSLASPEVPVGADGKALIEGANAGFVSQLSGTGLWATYILGIAAIVASVYSSIVKVFK